MHRRVCPLGDAVTGPHGRCGVRTLRHTRAIEKSPIFRINAHTRAVLSTDHARGAPRRSARRREYAGVTRFGRGVREARSRRRSARKWPGPDHSSPFAAHVHSPRRGPDPAPARERSKARTRLSDHVETRRPRAPGRVLMDGARRAPPKFEDRSSLCHLARTRVLTLPARDARQRFSAECGHGTGVACRPHVVAWSTRV